MLAAFAVGLPMRPALAADAASIKAYPCAAGQAENIAARLRAEFQGDPSVRIAADARSNQVLVHAPAEIQAKVMDRLAAGANNPNEAISRPVTPHRANPADRNSPSSSILPLRHQSSKVIEDSLVKLLGQRLAPATAQELGTKSYTLNAPGAGSLRIDVQPQTNRLVLQGPAGMVASVGRLVQAMDTADAGPDKITRPVALERSSEATARRTFEAIAASGGNRPARQPMVAVLFQKPDDVGPPSPPAGEPPRNGEAPRNPENTPAGQPPVGQPPAGQPAGAPPPAGSMIGPVRVEMLDGLDVLILQGHQDDVIRVMEIINQIEKLSAETEPTITVYPLKHVDSGALTELIGPLYDQIYSIRQGFVSINALVKPNSLLLIGRRESVNTVLELVKKLDKPVDPQTQFQVFRLKHAGALSAQQTVMEFFAPRGGMGPRVWVTADFRTNALIIAASPRDLAEVAAVIDRLDTSTSAAVNELRVFQLQNSLAEELAPLLQAAVTGQQVAQRTGGIGGFGGIQQQPALPGMQGAAGQRPQDQKSMMLRFVTVDTKGQRRLESGILTDVRITADTRANSLLVSAPAESMELLSALIQQLDRLPAAEAQIKVFTIVNGDASSLVEMLQNLFSRQQQAGPAIQLGAMLGSVTGDNQVVTLRFAVDVRTNSIIASGTPGDLQVVEAILLRLDDSDVRHRRSVVYRLKNAPSLDVATAINQFLQTERQVQQVAPGLISPFEQIEREVVVVPEPVSNSLIVSATPRYFDEIKRIVEELDQRPPMVLIQVLIAEVVLNNTDEFGVELGLQDSILFDRSLLGNVITTTKTTYDTNGNPTSQNQEIVSATYTPGFAFNNQPLGQSSGQGTSQIVGSQGLSTFSLGRTNNDLGFGGMVLSASSESVSVLIRALKECRRLDVLSRPQVMTLDNQPAFIQVGQRVPRIVGTTVNQTGQVNNITLENVGLILGVTPRISPEGLIVMEIDAEKSEVGAEAEGIPVSISATGQVIRSPRINTITAQTTVSASNGQTILLGGLITKKKTEFHRKVPLLGDIPILGLAFRYDGVANQKTELLIIMTPHVVRTEADAERVKRVESARMHWCLGDVLKMHGMEGVGNRGDECPDAETVVIYPDSNPAGKFSAAPGQGAAVGPELVPAPHTAPGAAAPSTSPTPMPPTPMPPPATMPTVPPLPTPATGRPMVPPMPSKPMWTPAPATAPATIPAPATPTAPPPQFTPTPAAPPTPLAEPPTEPSFPSPLNEDASSAAGPLLRMRNQPNASVAPRRGETVQPATYQTPAYQPPATSGYGAAQWPQAPAAASQGTVPAGYTAAGPTNANYAPPAGYAPPAYTPPPSGYAPPAYAPPPSGYAPPSR